MERQERIKIDDIEEVQTDWLKPFKKEEKAIPEELKKFMDDRSTQGEINNRIIRIPQTDIFLIYIANEILVANSTNLHFVTKKKEEAHEKILIDKNFGCAKFEKEIKILSF